MKQLVSPSFLPVIDNLDKPGLIHIFSTPLARTPHMSETLPFVLLKDYVKLNFAWNHLVARAGS